MEKSNTIWYSFLMGEGERNEFTEVVADFEILGEPASKSNQRRIVLVGSAPRVIKSKKALDYLKGFSAQCPRLDPLLEDDLELEVEVWFASRRPDLDGAVSLVMDAMQGLLYKNDRQVKVIKAFWNLDRGNPRSRITLRCQG